LLLLAAVVITGCAVQSQPPAHGTAPPPPQTQQPPPGYPTTPIPEQVPIIEAPSTTAPGQAQPKPGTSVTLALQDESRRAAAAGDLPKAIQILERAIRIQPDRAELWIDLARLHLKEGNPAQAEQFARKALLFTGQRYDLEQQAWVVIADARAAED
jgi:cytochrome c-type biogenesis protein CcmH/NrfG